MILAELAPELAALRARASCSARSCPRWNS